MSVKIDGIEYISDAPLPKDADKSIQFILVRLLIGPTTLSYISKRIRQDKNYSTIPSSIQTNKRGSAAFKQFVITYNLGCTATKFVKNTLPHNRAFFQDVLTEFSHHFIQNNRQSHISAFVFLYRLLERMSFSTPLLYCKKSHDFIGTFDALKGLYSEVSGEHGLFKKFLKSGKFIDRTILDTTYNIDFSTYADGQKYYDLIIQLFKKYESTNATTLQLEIKFQEVPDLLILIRNRFFHTRTGDGQANIVIKNLGDADNFFLELNKVFCSFLAVVALHIVVP